MYGLIYKDLHNTRKELFIGILMCLIFLVFGASVGSELSPANLGPAYGVIISIGAISATYSLHYDKACGWNKFICASPISRFKVIASKYLFGIASALFFTLLSVGVNLFSGCMLPFWGHLVFLCIILLLQSVMIPVALRLGQNFMVIVFLLMIFIPIGLGFLLYRWNLLTDALISGFFQWIKTRPALSGTAAGAVVLTLYGASFLISRHFYEKMEF